MILNKKWILCIACALLGIVFTSCIDDEEEQFQCKPTIPVEADLIDAWTIEYEQYVQKVDNEIVKSQDFTKQQGKNLQINKDYTWTYTGTHNGKDILKSGTWNYEEGKLYLLLQEDNETNKNVFRVFKLCSLRLRADFKYQQEIDGITNNYEVSLILLRNNTK